MVVMWCFAFTSSGEHYKRLHRKSSKGDRLYWNKQLDISQRISDFFQPPTLLSGPQEFPCNVYLPVLILDYQVCVVVWSSGCISVHCLEHAIAKSLPLLLFVGNRLFQPSFTEVLFEELIIALLLCINLIKPVCYTNYSVVDLRLMGVMIEILIGSVFKVLLCILKVTSFHDPQQFSLQGVKRC